MIPCAYSQILMLAGRYIAEAVVIRLYIDRKVPRDPNGGRLYKLVPIAIYRYHQSNTFRYSRIELFKSIDKTRVVLVKILFALLMRVM